jgi:hypothetical protein
MMLARIGGAALLACLLTSGTALAANERHKPAADANNSGGLFQGTPEEQRACNPDATRYCVDDIPDTFKVLACLQQHRAKLTKACRGVLEAHGQ